MQLKNGVTVKQLKDGTPVVARSNSWHAGEIGVIDGIGRAESDCRDSYAVRLPDGRLFAAFPEEIEEVQVHQ